MCFRRNRHIVLILILCLLVSGCGTATTAEPESFLYPYEESDISGDRPIRAAETLEQALDRYRTVVRADFVGYESDENRDRMIFSVEEVLKGHFREMYLIEGSEKEILVTNEIENVPLGYVSGLYRYEPGQTYILVLRYDMIRTVYTHNDIFLPFEDASFCMMYNEPLADHLIGRDHAFTDGSELDVFIRDQLGRGEAELLPPGSLPVVYDSAVLRMAMTSSPHILRYDYDKNDLTTWLQDRTNVEIEFLLYPEERADEELRLALTTGTDVGDVILYDFGVDPLVEFAEAGSLMDLSDLLHERGYNFLQMMDTYDASWKSLTFADGGIYALPEAGANALSATDYSMRHWIHTDFLQQYNDANGIQFGTIPQTTEAYRAFLVWCRDNIDGSVGWSGAENRSVWFARPTDFLMNAFTCQDENGYYQKDGIVHAAFVEDAYREGLKYLRGLMADGLMDPEYIEKDQNALRELVATNYGNTVASGSWGGMHNAAIDHEIRLRYEIVPPLEGPDGFRYAFYDQFNQSVRPGPVVIPANAACPELAVAWFDACCDSETYLRSRYGLLGTNWVAPPEGTIAIDGGPALYRDINNHWSVPAHNTWAPYTNNPCLWSMIDSSMSEPQPETNANGDPTYDLGSELYDASRLYEPYVVPCDMPTFLFDNATQTRLQVLKEQIETTYRAAVTDFIFGTRNVHSDADWAEYIAEMDAAGVYEVLDIMQEEFEDGWADAVPDVYTPWLKRK